MIIAGVVVVGSAVGSVDVVVILAEVVVMTGVVVVL